MALLPILRYPDARLHKVAQPVATVDVALRQLIDKYIRTIDTGDSLGLLCDYRGAMTHALGTLANNCALASLDLDGDADDARRGGRDGHLAGQQAPHHQDRLRHGTSRRRRRRTSSRSIRRHRVLMRPAP